MRVVKQTSAATRTPALFICGNARGGTTLLVRLLDGHPDLLVLPTETQIYPALATGPAAKWLLRLAELAGWRGAVRALAHPAVARAGFGGRAALAARLRAWAREYPSAADLDAAVFDAAAMRVSGPHQYWDAFLDVFAALGGGAPDGKRYWVEKTPRAERFAAVTDAWCGGTCRFLHVVRDPRDFIASYLIREVRLGGVEDRNQQIVSLCWIWSQSLEWCRHGIRTIEGRYHALRYEDLVRDTAGTMAAVCTAIDIAKDARLATATRMGEPVAHNSSDLTAAGAPGEVIHAGIGRFAGSLEPAEVAHIEWLLGAQMEACGYERLMISRGVPARGGPDTLGKMPWRVRVHAGVTARRRGAWRGTRLPFLG